MRARNLLKKMQKFPEKKYDAVTDFKLKSVNRFGDEVNLYYKKIKSNYNFSQKRVQSISIGDSVISMVVII